MSVTTRPVLCAPEIVGVSKAIKEVIRLIDTVAASDCCVLIEGESGTGKELLARRLCLKSQRRDKPFIPINCAGISASLFESQFFGHVRGAFTGAEQSTLGLIRTADSGTLFLDEVGEIPLKLQPKLLRVIQEQEVMPVGKPIPVKVNTRFIAGTNRNLRELALKGRFRQDLFYRLNIVRVVVSPLRERAEDIGPLLDHFLAHYARHYKAPRIAVPPAIRSVLLGYAWPGNVRELAAWVERLYATGLDAEVLLESLLIESNGPDETPLDDLNLQRLERRAIARAMDQTNFNQRKAAHLLQVHRATLARKLKKHGMA
jgi:two-component system, NtrC family, response regulator AtoC